MKYRTINKEQISNSETFIEISSNKWKGVGYISLQLFKELMEKSNINLLEFVDQNINITRPPNTYPVNSKMDMAVDDNYLYIWIKDHWKRIPITNF